MIILVAQSTFALEVDEKLTLRILKTSESGKTILINRGFEDGLVKGDHAKFFLSVGVVARGVLLKGSPTRSVWSIYRLVNKGYIRDDQVMNLKITAPVKVTKDESKTLVQDDTSAILKGDPRELNIPLAPGADDLSQEDKALLENRERLLVDRDSMINLTDKNREVYTTFFYASYTTTATPDKSKTTYTSSESMTAITLGYEHYFKDEALWFSRVSLLANLSMVKVGAMSHEGTATNDSSNEYGVGINVYPFKRPKFAGEFIYYGNFSLAMGSTTTTYRPGHSAPDSVTDKSLSGSILMYSFGAGVKYYTTKAYGARIQFDYISRADQFGSDGYDSWIKSRSGPRVVMGFSYRF